MKPKRYPYSGKKKEFTFKVIDLMMDGDYSVESIINNRLAQIYGSGEDTIKQFLEFRKKFTKRQWADLETAINARFSEKADQLKLDDFDLKVVTERLERYL